MTHPTQEASPLHCRNGLGSTLDIQLAEGRPQMRLDSALRDVQPSADCLVAQPFDDKPQNVLFAHRDRFAEHAFRQPHCHLRTQMTRAPVYGSHPRGELI